MGSDARLDGEEAIDDPFYVTAHEVAHQWWGQQMVGANVRGVAMLHETLAQYPAPMVMENAFGQQGMRRVLACEHDWYRRDQRPARMAIVPYCKPIRREKPSRPRGAPTGGCLRFRGSRAEGEVEVLQRLRRRALEQVVDRDRGDNVRAVLSAGAQAGRVDDEGAAAPPFGGTKSPGR